jgi:hypothetical protein
MKLKHKIDYKGLEDYLKTLDRKEIEGDFNKPENPKLIEGHSILDIDYFKIDINKYKPESIIQYGEPFLVDAIGNDLSIVILSRRKYKLPTGRAINAKFVTTIIDDCRAIYGTPLNGYWKIPSQFIKPI